MLSMDDSRLLAYTQITDLVVRRHISFALVAKDCFQLQEFF